MPFMFWVWLSVIFAATVIELMTWNLTSIWFAIAALVAFILSIFKGIKWEIQLTVFIVLSITLMVSLRKLSLRLFFKNTDGKTNTLEFIGKKYKLQKAITSDEMGLIKINGILWNAKTEDDYTISEGEYVEVLKIQGNKLIVVKANKEI